MKLEANVIIFIRCLTPESRWDWAWICFIIKRGWVSLQLIRCFSEACHRILLVTKYAYIESDAVWAHAIRVYYLSGYWLSPPRIKEFCVEIDQSTMFNLPFSQTDKHRNQIADVYCSKATTKMFAFELDSIDLCSMHSSLRWAGNYHLNSHHYAFSPRVQTVVVQTIALGHSCGTSSHSANTEKWTRQLWLQSSKIGGSLGLWASNRHSFDWHAFALERKLES